MPTSPRPIVTLAQLRDDREHVTRLARQPGGVEVVDEQGRRAFLLSIPCEPIDDAPPLSISKNRSVILRLSSARQGAIARWLGRAVAAGVGAAVISLARYLIGW